MVSNPLSYDGLKCVLQYMEPRTRFQIANCCPSIRTTERAMPLVIDYLHFTKGAIRVNNSTFKIGIYRKYNGDDADIRRENESGGVEYEVDRFGEVDNSDESTLTPGDVKISFPQIYRKVGDTWQWNSKQKILEKIKNLRQLIALGERRQLKLPETLENIRIQLRQAQLELENIPPPYENFVQFTLTKSARQKTIERYVHNKKYSEALKQLGTFLFGGIRNLILVKHFQMSGLQLVLRLPLGLKFVIQTLDFPYSPVHTTLDVLNPIVHESSYPFKKLAIRAHVEQDVTNQIVREAQILELKNHTAFQVLSNISNKVVHIIPNNYVNEVNYFIDLIANWIENRREVGTEFSFFRNVEEAPLETIKVYFFGTYVMNGVLYVPMTATSEIRVDNKQIAECEGRRAGWAVTISVIARSYPF